MAFPIQRIYYMMKDRIIDRECCSCAYLTITNSFAALISTHISIIVSPNKSMIFLAISNGAILIYATTAKIKDSLPIVGAISCYPCFNRV